MATDIYSDFRYLGGVLPEVKGALVMLMKYAKEIGADSTRAWQGYNIKSRPEHSSRLAFDLGNNGSWSPGRAPTSLQRTQHNQIVNFGISQFGHCLKWVLNEQKAWNPTRKSWRQMENRGSNSANHIDHSHWFFNVDKLPELRRIVIPVPSDPASSTQPVVHKLPKLAVDEYFGNGTLNGWQRWAGLRPVSRLKVPYHNIVWTRIPTSILTNYEAEKVQQKLITRGHKIKADGLFLTNSIKAMQEEINRSRNVTKKIDVDGKWGNKTTGGLQIYLNWWNGHN